MVHYYMHEIDPCAISDSASPLTSHEDTINATDDILLTYNYGKKYLHRTWYVITNVLIRYHSACMILGHAKLPPLYAFDMIHQNAWDPTLRQEGSDSTEIVFLSIDTKYSLGTSALLYLHPSILHSTVN